MIEKYRIQVISLAKELKCRLEIDSKFRTSAMMYVENEPPYVEVPPIESQIDYLINLHELGHAFHAHDQGRPPYQHKTFYFDNGVLHSEAQAWNYALDKCIDELEPNSRLFMWNLCLGSYYLGSMNNAKLTPANHPKIKDRLLNGNRHHVAFLWDDVDIYFDETVKRIQGNLSKDNYIPYKPYAPNLNL